ncbi:MAG: AMMECR1 domain-containing protein [Desulfovibrio sp.]|nr:AMMECR1 domain-containing protein [Desulfovibrio sp.]
MDQDRPLNPDEKKELLAIARQTVTRLASGQPPQRVKSDTEGLNFSRGAFVTLHKQGQLRGCIGNFFAEGALLDTVQEMAKAAASQDPRFRPVKAMELADLDLEISVLSPLKECADVNEIQVGVHGIYIVSPRGRGVLLPQVATEYGWDRDAFLDHTCMKAGLQPGCWRDPQTKILIFSAQVFGEKDLGQG